MFFKGTPAQDIPKNCKHGWLERKEKFLFIGHQKRVYAFVLQQWLVIYYSEKDNKPIEIMNLLNYEVEEINSPKNNKHIFQLVSKKDSSKICTVSHFISLLPLD